MSAVPHRKVNRDQVLEEVKKLIKSSPNGEVEISSSELADKFNVQAPTMDYHLKKLVQEGLLKLLPKRGRYNRKIYRLPTANSDIEIHQPHLSAESAEKFKNFLEEHLRKTKEASANVKQEEEKEEEIKEETEVKEEIKEEIKEELPQDVEKEDTVTASKSDSKEKTLPEVKPLTLDEQIQSFLNSAEQVHDAEELLQHEDREILSVMNETINQTVVYLKDLSEQLSTVQNKQLIQHLIDDRNRMQKQMEYLEKEVEEARKQAEQTVEKNEIDPSRIRFMQQIIISTLDTYLNQTNPGLALGRKDFRNKISKEISDLVRYALHLEE